MYHPFFSQGAQNNAFESISNFQKKFFSKNISKTGFLIIMILKSIEWIVAFHICCHTKNWKYYRCAALKITKSIAGQLISTVIYA